jgi:hypothetical protein
MSASGIEPAAALSDEQSVQRFERPQIGRKGTRLANTFQKRSGCRCAYPRSTISEPPNPRSPGRMTCRRARFRFVRHNAANETVACALADEGATFDRLAAKSAALGARLMPDGDRVQVAL